MRNSVKNPKYNKAMCFVPLAPTGIYMKRDKERNAKKRETNSLEIELKRGRLMTGLKQILPERKGKRAQASLEFLMTYGWAILVVMIVIGALAYFGVLNPTIMLPEKCTFQMGLYCKNHLIQMTGVSPTQVNHTVYFELENGMGKGIIITEVNLTGDSINCGVTTTSAPVGSMWNDNFGNKAGMRIAQGRGKILIINEPRDRATGAGIGTLGWMNCSIVPALGKAKADIRLRWYFEDATATFTHTMNGEILANIEDTT